MPWLATLTRPTKCTPLWSKLYQPSRGPLAEPLEVLAVVADDVVLAGHVEDLADLDPLEDLGDGVELLRLREVGEVAGVDQEVGRLRQRVDPGHGLLERGGHVACSASLLKPMWLSLIWTNEKSAAGRSLSGSGRKRPDGTPPPTVQSTPVPTHAMHLRNPRRSMPSPMVDADPNVASIVS